MRKEPLDLNTQIEQARLDYDIQRSLLESAHERYAAAGGFVGTTAARASIWYREKTVYDSDQHLGMLEAMRALQEGRAINPSQFE